MAVVLSVSTFPAVAVEYLPGLSVGQWVRYGEIINTMPDAANISAWMVEVTAVFGKTVTLRTVGELKDGGVAQEETHVCDVEAGKIDGTKAYWMPVIAADLKEGDALPPFELGMKINKTETRTYVGVSRTVNIYKAVAEYGVAGSPDSRSSTTLVYDRASGILLELDMSTISVAGEFRAYYIATDTNIFEGKPVGENGIGVCLAAMAVAVLVMRKAGMEVLEPLAASC